MKLFRRLIDDYAIILSDVQRHHVDALLQEVDRRLALAGFKVQKGGLRPPSHAPRAHVRHAPV